MATEKVIIEAVLDLDTNSIKGEIKKIQKEADSSGTKSGKDFGKSFGSQAEEAINSSFKSIGRTIVAFGAVALGSFAFDKIIDGALRQEDAVNKLNSSLQRTGEYSQETSQDLQDYASSLQKVTRFGDEAIIEQLAFAQSMGATAEQSKQVLSAATNLAAALSIDLNSATRNVAKTLGGFAGELGEVIPELKGLTQEQLRNGDAIELLGKKYAGFAEKDAKSTQGSFDQLKNSVGDFAEELGFLVTQSPQTSGFFGALKVAADFYTNALGGARKASARDLKDIEADIAKASNLLLTEQAKLDNALGSTGLFGKFLKADFNVNQFKEQIDKAKLQLIEFEQEKLAIEEAARQQKEIKDQSVIAKEIALNEQRKEILKNYGIFKLEDIENQFVKEIEAITALEEQKRISEEQARELVLAADQNFEAQRTAMAKKGADERTAIAKQSTAIFNSVISNGIANFAKSLAQGENAGEAFKNVLLTSLGDLATQLGSVMIAAGIAEANLFTGNPTASIAAGAALVALGQILSTVGGSGLKSFGSQGSGASGVYTPPEDLTTSQIETESAEPKNSVTVNIQGDVLDSEASGSRIISLINTAVDGNGYTINRNAIA